MGVLQTPAFPLGYVAGDSLPSRWYFTTGVDGASSATGLSAYWQLKTEDGYDIVEEVEDAPHGSVEWCFHIRRGVFKWVPERAAKARSRTHLPGCRPWHSCREQDCSACCSSGSGGTAYLRPPGSAPAQSAPRFSVCGMLFTLHGCGRVAGSNPLDSVHIPAMRAFLSKQETCKWLVYALQIPGLTPFYSRVLEAVCGKER